MHSTTPPFDDPAAAADTLREHGYVILAPDAVAALAGCTTGQLDSLKAAWDDLAPDQYLKDGGRYRRRRHSCFVQEGLELTAAPHRAHWQPVEYNALHGGMHRMFEPVGDATRSNPAFIRLVTALGSLCAQVRPVARWFVEAHQFRIDTAGGIGRPTPEGAHRDGVDFVAVLLVGRHGIKGGETRIFEADGPNGKRFTMQEPWTLLLMDDAAVIHESTPIQPLAEHGHRDTLVITWRARGFLGDVP
ncbi:MAG: 2OG-Fe dioxygenase family protein [Telluria sp.]